MPDIQIEDEDRGSWTLLGQAAGPRVLVVLAGAGFGHARLREEAGRCAALVAADAGAALCLAAGLMPDAVVGDFDSLPADARARIAPDLLHASDDPETNDLEKALAFIAEAWGADAEVVLAAGGGVDGGRMDHALANLGPLVREPHARISMLDGEGRLIALRKGTVTIDGLAGRRLSLLPWTLQGVTATESGMRYPLDRAHVTLRGRGVSNEIVAERAVVEVRSGVALVWIEA
ncbi:MAG: thiamine diphosphokinase [Candidatus Eisenbacteria bacterium]